MARFDLKNAVRKRRRTHHEFATALEKLAADGFTDLAYDSATNRITDHRIA
jgi:hypothetical protein